MKQYSDHNFEQCTKCTVCTVYCPVVAVNPLYPGPKQAGPDGERLRMKGGEFFDESLNMCLNCKRCEVACPSDVRIGDIIQPITLPGIRVGLTVSISPITSSTCRIRQIGKRTTSLTAISASPMRLRPIGSCSARSSGTTRARLPKVRNIPIFAIRLALVTSGNNAKRGMG